MGVFFYTISFLFIVCLSLVRYTFSNMDGITEQGGGFLILFFLGIFIGPMYLCLLIAGYFTRKKLIMHPIAKWAYIVSLPLAILTAASLMMFGDNESGNSTGAGEIIGVIVTISIIAGILALLVIVGQNIAALMKNRSHR